MGTPWLQEGGLARGPGSAPRPSLQTSCPGLLPPPSCAAGQLQVAQVRVR